MNRNRQRRHARRRLLGERCEPRYCLSGVAFSTHDIVASDAYQRLVCRRGGRGWRWGRGCALSVLDDDKIAWYENTTGRAASDRSSVISTAADGATSVFAADMDGDGDLDVLSASQATTRSPGTRTRTDRELWSAAGDHHGSAAMPDSVFAADLDGDGDLDVLSASFADSKIAWYENTDGRARFGPQQVITHGSGFAPIRCSRRTWTGTGIWMCSRRPTLTTRSPGTRTRTDTAAFGTRR